MQNKNIRQRKFIGDYTMILYKDNSMSIDIPDKELVYLNKEETDILKKFLDPTVLFGLIDGEIREIN